MGRARQDYWYRGLPKGALKVCEASRVNLVSPLKTLLVGETYEVKKGAISGLMDRMWRDIARDVNGISIEEATAVLVAFGEIGLFTEKQVEGWHIRFMRCPGHTPGQEWCYYCTGMEQLI